MKVHALAVAAIASGMALAPVAAQAGTTAASVKSGVSSYGQRSTAKVAGKKKAGEELLLGLALAAGSVGVLIATDVIGGGGDDDVRTPGA